MADKKTAKIGKTRNGTSEFGEIYHTVVGKKLYRDFYPQFVDFPAGKHFYELFAKDEKQKDADDIHLGETANWIFRDYNPKIAGELWKPISDLAKKEKWTNNLPKAFRALLTNDPKVLIWLRSKTYCPERNVSLKAIEQLTELCTKGGALPVFIGGKLMGMSEGAIGLWNFYEDDFFEKSSIAKQLWCLNLLYEKGNVLASVGMMSGAMDGLAMICEKKVVFLAKKEDAAPQMAKVSMVVPALHWVELFYQGNFQQLLDDELREIEKRIWG
jgi:hypothetical protein